MTTSPPAEFETTGSGGGFGGVVMPVGVYVVKDEQRSLGSGGQRQSGDRRRLPHVADALLAPDDGPVATLRSAARTSRHRRRLTIATLMIEP